MGRWLHGPERAARAKGAICSSKRPPRSPVARAGALSPRKPNELPTVFYDNVPAAPPWDFVDGHRKFTVAPRSIMRLSTLTMVRDAVLEGAGFSMLPDTLVGDDIADGTLVHVGDLDRVDVDLSIVHPSRRLMSRRLRTFIDMLVETFPRGDKPATKTRRSRASRTTSSRIGRLDVLRT